jgi:hypothetical protein
MEIQGMQAVLVGGASGIARNRGAARGEGGRAAIRAEVRTAQAIP